MVVKGSRFTGIVTEDWLGTHISESYLHYGNTASSYSLFSCGHFCLNPEQGPRCCNCLVARNRIECQICNTKNIYKVWSNYEKSK